MSARIQIVEVGPRDGLQNEAKVLSVEERLRIVDGLVASGLKRIEIGAFVSPKWVPQMSESQLVVRDCLKKHGDSSRGVRFSCLVPNARGMVDAIDSGIKEVAVFGACSESFSKKNINCTIEESFTRFEEVVDMARTKKIKVRAYLSTAFGCPYEGLVPVGRVLKLTKRLVELGVYEISLGDTIGVATPKQVRVLLEKFEKDLGLKQLALHFHDTRGTALANAFAAYELGIRVFDSSVGGLGGCPYANGASGNLATEDLVYMFEGMGIRTGVDLSQLIDFNREISSLIGHDLPSRVGRAGLPLAFRQ